MGRTHTTESDPDPLLAGRWRRRMAVRAFLRQQEQERACEMTPEDHKRNHEFIRRKKGLPDEG